MTASGGKGRVWFAIQAVIALALLVTPVVSRAPWSPMVRAVGAGVFVVGLGFLVWSYRVLGGSHSPWTAPREGASLVTNGPYRIVRHPVYAAYVVIGLGLEVMLASPAGLIVAAVAYGYYHLRTREEERWLVQTYPDYATYRERVRGRLLPGIGSIGSRPRLP